MQVQNPNYYSPWKGRVVSITYKGGFHTNFALSTVFGSFSPTAYNIYSIEASRRLGAL